VGDFRITPERPGITKKHDRRAAIAEANRSRRRHTCFENKFARSYRSKIAPPSSRKPSPASRNSCGRGCFWRAGFAVYQHPILAANNSKNFPLRENRASCARQANTQKFPCAHTRQSFFLTSPPREAHRHLPGHSRHPRRARKRSGRSDLSQNFVHVDANGTEAISARATALSGNPIAAPSETGAMQSSRSAPTRSVRIRRGHATNRALIVYSSATGRAHTRINFNSQSGRIDNKEGRTQRYESTQTTRCTTHTCVSPRRGGGGPQILHTLDLEPGQNNGRNTSLSCMTKTRSLRVFCIRDNRNSLQSQSQEAAGLRVPRKQTQTNRGRRPE